VQALSTRSSPIAAIWAALLIGVSLWEIAATRCDATSVPDDEAWDRAAQLVRAGFQPDDLIVFAPGWVDPVGRLHLGDLLSIDAAARMDAARYPRIWELSIRGARSPDTEGLEPVSDVDVDGVRVRRYDQHAVTVTADVRDQLSAAKVEGTPLHAPSLEIAEVGFAPHRCIEVVPAPGKPVRLTFSQLALGHELVGYMGLADVFTRREIRSPGALAVEIGGVQVAAMTAGVDDGWVRFSAPTTPGPADVTFVLTASERDRLICFAAEARQ
jgi:hypothetical protein